MAIAYHILAHKNPQQVRRMLGAIDHPDDVFVLHFDERSPGELHHLAREWADSRPNVIIQKSRTILWGGPQLVETQIEAMRLALAHPANIPWTHFINLSGQDFPLEARPQIIAQLESAPSASYVDWFDPFETGQWADLTHRIGRWHLHSPTLQRLLSLPGLGRRIRQVLGWQNRLPFVPHFWREPATFFRYFGGSNHVILSREACTYCAENPEAERIRKWLVKTGIPDESTFQSILLNSPLAPTLVKHNWRIIDFAIGTQHPLTFKSDDFLRLITSGEWFARKFDEAVDATILSKLETRLHNLAHQ